MLSGLGAGPPAAFAGARPARPTTPAPGSVLTGTVKSYSARGYGFILCPELDHDVYFAKECLQAGLRTANIAGTVVDFELMRGLGGKPQARYLRPQAGSLPPNFADAGPRGAAALARATTAHVVLPPGGTISAGGSSSSTGPAPCASGAHGYGVQQFQGPQGFGTQQYHGGFGYGMQQVQGFPSMAAQHMQNGPPPACAPHFGNGVEAGSIVQPSGVHMAAFPSGKGGPMVPPPRPVAVKRDLSPHAGSRAIAGLKRQEMEANARGAKSSSSQSSCSSSSSKRRKKKKKGKKRKRSSSASSSSGAKKSRPSRSRSRRPDSQGQTAADENAADMSNPEVDAAKKEALERLQELRKLEPKDTRMKEWRALLRAWHPDKNPERTEVATAVFQFLQKGKLLLDA